MTTKTEITGKISAVDADGNRYTIIKYTEFYEQREVIGGVKWLPGHDTYKLQNGGTVEKISDGEFRVLASDLKLFVK
jgi:hypothetical protein